MGTQGSEFKEALAHRVMPGPAPQWHELEPECLSHFARCLRHPHPALPQVGNFLEETGGILGLLAASGLWSHRDLVSILALAAYQLGDCDIYSLI